MSEEKKPANNTVVVTHIPREPKGDRRDRRGGRGGRAGRAGRNLQSINTTVNQIAAKLATEGKAEEAVKLLSAAASPSEQKHDRPRQGAYRPNRPPHPRLNDGGNFLPVGGKDLTINVKFGNGPFVKVQQASLGDTVSVFTRYVGETLTLYRVKLGKDGQCVTESIASAQWDGKSATRGDVGKVFNEATKGLVLPPITPGAKDKAPTPSAPEKPKGGRGGRGGVKPTRLFTKNEGDLRVSGMDDTDF